MHLTTIVQCLKHFRSVVDSCFSHCLHRGFEEKISTLISSLKHFQNLAEFFKFHQSGLGKFAEQTGESIHAQYKKTWERYKRDPCHNKHGKYMKTSIINFNRRRL